MEHIYVIKAFDTQSWKEIRRTIAFRSEEEAREYCLENNDPEDTIYSWDKIMIGKVHPPYSQKPQMISFLP